MLCERTVYHSVIVGCVVVSGGVLDGKRTDDASHRNVSGLCHIDHFPEFKSHVEPCVSFVMKGYLVSGLMTVKDSLRSLEDVHADLGIQIPLFPGRIYEIVISHHHKAGYHKSAAVEHRIWCRCRAQGCSSRSHMVTSSGGIPFSHKTHQNLRVIFLEIR